MNVLQNTLSIVLEDCTLVQVPHNYGTIKQSGSKAPVWILKATVPESAFSLAPESGEIVEVFQASYKGAFDGVYRRDENKPKFVGQGLVDGQENGLWHVLIPDYVIYPEADIPKAEWFAPTRIDYTPANS